MHAIKKHNGCLSLPLIEVTFQGFEEFFADFSFHGSSVWPN